MLHARQIVDIDEKWEQTLNTMTEHNDNYKFMDNGYPLQLITEHEGKIQNISYNEA